MLQTTLGIMILDGKIFLGRKKRGFAKGVLNGIGGKINIGENIDDCMIREAYEEIGIDIKKDNLEYLGVLHFYFEEKKEWNQDVHLYNIKKYRGNIVESDEIEPFWFSLDNIPYNKMWEDDKKWLPRILSGEKDIEYNFYFDKENGKMVNWKVIK